MLSGQISAPLWANFISSKCPDDLSLTGSPKRSVSVFPDVIKEILEVKKKKKQVFKLLWVQSWAAAVLAEPDQPLK